MFSFHKKVNAPTHLPLWFTMISSMPSGFQRELIQDRFSRTISYLRLSITDRCNLRCLYCLPPATLVSHSELLSYEEMLRVVQIAVNMGMNKLRLTGGEPLVRRGILDFIHKLNRIEGLEEIRLTTNGVLLHDMATELHRAGIRNLNISLDSMKRERFLAITGADFFDQVWQSIQTASYLGFNVKINVVAMRGINDDEFLDFADLALREPIQVRFIEFMPIGNRESWEKDRFISAAELQTQIQAKGMLEPVSGSRLDGPARVYRLSTPDGRSGKVGFISPISHHFCDQCNRLRLTSEGRLRACLLHHHETDLKSLLRQGADDHRIQTAIRQTILDKPKGHDLRETQPGAELNNCQGRMSRIGG